VERESDAQEPWSFDPWRGGVKAVTWAQGPEANSLIGGMLQTGNALPIDEFPWVTVNAFLRTVSHQSTAPDAAFTTSAAPFDWFLSKGSMRTARFDPDEFWLDAANYQQQFDKLWGVTK
jgi:hypothetical protein